MAIAHTGCSSAVHSVLAIEIDLPGNDGKPPFIKFMNLAALKRDTDAIGILTSQVEAAAKKVIPHGKRFGA